MGDDRDVLVRAGAVFEELVGVVHGGWVGVLDPARFVLRGERDVRDGKLRVSVVGHESLSHGQWKNWVVGSLLRAGALRDVAEKVLEAGLSLVDMTSHGSVGRANKPYAAGMVLFLDDLHLRAENLGLHPAACSEFQRRVYGKTFSSLDLMHMLREADPLVGRGAAQTAGDTLYKKDTVAGYGTM